MNRLNRYLFFGLVITSIWACREENPGIDFSLPCEGLFDTSYVTGSPAAPQPKAVLIEEFTGVACTKCPPGTVVFKSLISKHNGAVIGISLHTGFFAIPLPEDGLDFRLPKADAIAALLGPILGWPTAGVERKLYPGEIDILLPKGSWETYVDKQLLLSPEVNITLTNTYSAPSLVTRVELQYNEAVAGDNRLSIAIIESGIIGQQKDEFLGTIENYSHDYVLRGMMTGGTGNPITETKQAGRVIIKEFCFDIPSTWVLDNIDVVAFVHHGGDSLNVLQVAKLAL